MEKKYNIPDLFARSRDQPTGETILDAVVNVLRDSNAITSQQVADAIGVRRSHLCGAILLLTGQSLDVQIRDWRMLQAMQLIRHTDYDFEEIARRCGYADSKSLLKAMKRYLHVTPYEYRYGCHREEIRRYRRQHLP